MTKSSKATSVKVARSSRTGEFVVARPAVSSKIGSSKIRDAVRKVNQAQSAKK